MVLSMERGIEVLSAEALVLPVRERVALAHLLLSSVEPAGEGDADQAWEAEIQRRIGSYRAGKCETVDAETAFARLRRIAP